MAKFANDEVMDAALNFAASSVLMTVCAGQPATYASATTQGGQMLARYTVSAGDFTLADGLSSGRRVTVAQQTGIAVSATGAGNHVTLLAAASIRYITTATSQTLTAGNTLTVNAWDIEIADPS